MTDAEYDAAVADWPPLTQAQIDRVGSIVRSHLAGRTWAS